MFFSVFADHTGNGHSPSNVFVDVFA